MKVTICLVSISLLIAGLGHADSIRINGVLHKNVYIKKSARHYYVHFPTEGRVEKINRIRKGISDLSIDSDVEKRDALWKTYQEHKEKTEETRPDKAKKLPLP